MTRKFIGYSWQCDKCDTQTTTQSAEVRPISWAALIVGGPPNPPPTQDLCGSCYRSFLDWMIAPPKASVYDNA